MNQTNALKRLATILEEAHSSGNQDKSSGSVLSKAMNIEAKPRNLIKFCALLNRAEEEARQLKHIGNHDKSIEEIGKLQYLFARSNIWSEKWKTFSDYIENKNIILIISFLADKFHSRNPKLLLSQGFLDELKKKFLSLLGEVQASDLSEPLKTDLNNKIEDVLTAISQYNFEGSGGLERTTNSLLGNLILTEPSLKDEDKENPIYKKFKGLVLGLGLFLSPNIYDIIGTVPVIEQFWLPKIEGITEKITSQSELNIKEISKQFEAEVKNISNEQRKKQISGKEELKTLPAAKEDTEITTDNKD
ncbi:MAG: hypothetical protein F6K58_21905 [Symploca sp. SIO2E9]|nr:hypothetical protein [Symploca sp. SIO2E9]